MSNKIRSLTTAQYQALITGMPKYCPNSVFEIAGTSYTTPQVVALVQSVLNHAVAVAPAKATWLATTKAIDEAEATDGKIVKEVREVVALMYQNAPSTLAELAISPRKASKPLTAEARAAATAKARATRLARGTTSKKRKALVTGNVTGVNITPVTTPAAAPTATTAASSASLAGSAGGSTPHA